MTSGARRLVVALAGAVAVIGIGLRGQDALPQRPPSGAGPLNPGDMVAAFSSVVDGNRFDFAVTRRDVEGAPRWLITSDNPPLPPGEAVRSARLLLTQLLPSSETDTWRVATVALSPTPVTDAWVYVVTFESPGPIRTIGLVVLMDGRAVRPVVPPLPTSSLSAVRDALHRASSALSRSANQGCLVQKAVADIAETNTDLNGAFTFLNRHPDAAAAPPPPGPGGRPEFTPPARPAPQRNMMLEAALNNLEAAFDSLARSPGGDLGGFRMKMNDAIAAGASDLVGAITAANALFLDGRRDLPPCLGRPIGGTARPRD